jgi:hypothetical protein
MRKGKRVLIVLSTLLLFAAGCVTEPDLDRGKFAEMHRAAQDLKTAIRSGARCEFPDTLLQRLDSGTTALEDKTLSKAERELLSAYTHLLAVYQDGLFLCQSRTPSAGFSFVPKGRIYVTQELDPLVEKYDLETEQHQYGPTGKYWKSIPEDSITVIWERAEALIQNIENMTKYN